MELVTYNSKTDIYGSRRNLVVNHDTKELYFSTSHAFDRGLIYNECGIREVDRYYKDYLSEGYTEVKHSVVRDNW